MQEFIQMAVQQLGVSEGAAKGATGGLLGMIQKQAPAGDFDRLLSAVPGAKDLLGGATSTPAAPSGATSPAAGLGGALGGMLGKLGGNLPGSLGQAASIVGMLQQHGIGADKAGGFVKLFSQFLQSKAGKDLAGNLLTKVPDLKSLL